MRQFQQLPAILFSDKFVVLTNDTATHYGKQMLYYIWLFKTQPSTSQLCERYGMFYYFFSANGKFVAELSSRDKNKVLISPNGDALWSETAEFVTSCDINPQAFPFDVQTCALRVSGWMTDAYYINYTSRNIILSTFQDSTEWDLLAYKSNSSNLDIDGYTTSHVVFEFTFKRRSGYYVLTVIVPFIVVSILGLLTFPLPPESGEKVSLGMTCLLSFFVIQASVSEHLPTSSHSMPFIGRFSIQFNFLEF